MSATLPVPRATVASLVVRRNQILAAFSDAWAALTAGNEAIGAAVLMLHETTPGENSYNHHWRSEKSEFHQKSKIPDRAEYMAQARRIVDTDIWSHIIQLTALERLMDKKAKDQLRQQLMTEPPEVTEDNIYATLQTFLADADTIFKRGIAECFSALDRRFKSHDGWEIGSRIILSYAFDAYGWWNYNRNHQDSFADIERVFLTLDGKPIPPACQITEELRAARSGSSGPKQTVVETDYFTVRAFKNGNAHVWFKRDDLLVKVNRLLGEYYGAPIPEDREPDEDTGLHEPKTTPAKRYGFFPTPDDAAEHVMEQVSLYRDKTEPRLRVLEPSAGTGNLARRCAKLKIERWHSEDCRYDPQVDCVEIQPALADALRAEKIYANVYTADFLLLKPETTGLYDRVVMNPPFDRERDIDHMIHALKFLKPGGVLVAVMSAGTEFRNTMKSIAFRELMDKMGAQWRDLPPLSFASVGTNCNTRIVRVTKAREQQAKVA